jgi:steroid delta-isomerase-like uncharacterized protein
MTASRETPSPEMQVRRFYVELWDAGEAAVAHEILAADFRFRGSLGPERRGVEGFLGYWRDVRGALTDYRSDIEALLIDGRRAAARMTFSGRHVGAFYGAAPTGRRVSWSGAAFFDFADDGRIAALWVLGDVDGLKAQLGGAGFAPR